MTFYIILDWLLYAVNGYLKEELMTINLNLYPSSVYKQKKLVKGVTDSRKLSR